ncbi:uncharacterized protein LOC144291848 isoform X1 [Canis aureus]|eukprot:XP_022261888.1 uncharacterized protein LOC111091202 isoform X2 [Canis lupus familiaris]
MGSNPGFVWLRNPYAFHNNTARKTKGFWASAHSSGLLSGHPLWKTASNEFGAAGQEDAENVIQRVVLPDGQVTTEPYQTSPRKMYKLHMKFYRLLRKCIQYNGGQGTYQLNMLFQHIQSASGLNLKFISARIIYSVNLRVCMTPTRKIQKKFLFCSLDLFSHKTSSVVNNSSCWGSIIEGLAEKW